MSFRYIDMESYPRRAHFDYFISLQYPYVGTTVNVDITGLPECCRRGGRPFYTTFIHVAALAADGVPELRRRIREGRIVEYDQCPTSHIELLEDGAYCYCTLRHHMDLCSYYTQAERARRECGAKGIEEEEDVAGMYFISTLPWLSYTALIQPVAGGEEANPRITWGKYEKNAAGRLMMPVSILAHHGLVDGVHIAQFYKNLDAEIGKYLDLL